MKAVTLN